jgi:mono/diheme cytochrome c family protein
MKILKLSVAFATVALFVFACSDDRSSNANTSSVVVTNANTSAATTPATTAATSAVAEGQKIYNQTCANCHKEDGTGGKKVIEGKTINADNLTTDKMIQMADAKYVDYIKNGVPDEGMPAFKDRLNDEQISAVIKYIRTEFQKQ